MCPETDFPAPRLQFRSLSSCLMNKLTVSLQDLTPAHTQWRWLYLIGKQTSIG
jgi:hypothetical protein